MRSRSKRLMGVVAIGQISGNDPPSQGSTYHTYVIAVKDWISFEQFCMGTRTLTLPHYLLSPPITLFSLPDAHADRVVHAYLCRLRTARAATAYVTTATGNLGVTWRGQILRRLARATATGEDTRTWYM